MTKKDDSHFLYLLLLRGLSWLPREERGLAQALIEKMLFDGRRRWRTERYFFQKGRDNQK